MILADDNFATIIVAVREGRVVWDNLRKALLVNTPINNAQGLSILFGLLFGLSQTPLSSIQVLYANLITATTLGFVTSIEPAEDGIMEQPPRLIGRFLLLRIVIGTAALTFTTVGSVFWIKNDNEYTLDDTRAVGLNTLAFGAIASTMSARFARKSAFHRRSLQGNQFALWSYAIIAVLQVFITYTPGLNDVIFTMEGMDGKQWGIVFFLMFVVLLIMEGEKSVREYLSSLKYDTEDEEFDPVFESVVEPDRTPLPVEVSRFGKNELSR
jgi:magnesium-transporting ATPase (P-type)